MSSDAGWARLCKRPLKRCLIPWNVAVEDRDGAIVCRPRKDFSMLMKLAPSLVFGIIMAVIAVEIIIGARPGRSEYTAMLGGLGSLLILLTVIRVPVQLITFSVTDRRVEVTYGRFPFLTNVIFSPTGLTVRQDAHMSAEGVSHTRLVLYDPKRPEQAVSIGMNPLPEEAEFLRKWLEEA